MRSIADLFGNNYFTWNDKCLAKPKRFLPGHVSPQCNASKIEYISTTPNASVNYNSGNT